MKTLHAIFLVLVVAAPTGAAKGDDSFTALPWSGAAFRIGKEKTVLETSLRTVGPDVPVFGRSMLQLSAQVGVDEKTGLALFSSNDDPSEGLTLKSTLEFGNVWSFLDIDRAELSGADLDACDKEGISPCTTRTSPLKKKERVLAVPVKTDPSLYSYGLQLLVGFDRKEVYAIEDIAADSKTLSNRSPH